MDNKLGDRDDRDHGFNMDELSADCGFNMIKVVEANVAEQKILPVVFDNKQLLEPGEQAKLHGADSSYGDDHDDGKHGHGNPKTMMMTVERPCEQFGEKEESTILEQGTAVLGLNILESSKNNMLPDTQILIEDGVRSSFVASPQGEVEITEKCKSMTNDMSKIEHREMTINAMEAVNIDNFVAPEVMEKVSDRLYVGETPYCWENVLCVIFVFVQISKRIMRERPFRSYLNVLVKNFENALKGKPAEWIHRQGGWESYSCGKQCPSVKPIAELILSREEPFLVLLHDVPSKSNSSTEKLAVDIKDGFTKHNQLPRLFHCSGNDFHNPMEELRFFSKFPNAVFVVLITATSQKGKMKTYYDVILEKNDSTTLKTSRVIPVELYAMKQKDFPLCFKGTETLKAFPKIAYKSSEVRDFVGLLKGHFDSTFLRTIETDLTPNTDDQIEIKITVNIRTKKISDNDRQAITNTIKGQAKTILEDPWTPLRQHLLHMYRIKNIRIDNVPGSDHLVLEVLTMQWGDIEKLVGNYRSGLLDPIFPDHIKVPEVKDPYGFSLNIDEDKVKRIIKNLKSTTEASAMAAIFPNKKAILVGSIAKAMVDPDKKHSPYDLYVTLSSKKDECNIKEIADEGRNLLHMVVASSRPDCFKVIFYLNMWDELRLQMIDPEKDSQYGGYSPRGLAEKFLFKSKGPSTLEEYDHFDQLWLQMPLLHKACLAGNLSYVRALEEKGCDVQAKDQSGAQCILYACAVGSVSIINFLIEEGADPKEENSRGENGLILAAMFGKSAVVKVLLSRFDFTNEKLDSKNNRAIDYVAMNGDKETLNAFSEGGISPDEKLVSLAAKFKRKAMVEKLVIDYKLNVHGKDDDGRTPLLNAAAKGETETLRFLLAHENDHPQPDGEKSAGVIMERDKQNRNVLHMVAEFGHKDACSLLLEECTKRDCLKDLLDDRDFYTGRERLMIVRGRDRGRKAWHYLSIKRTLACSFKKKMSSGQIDVKLFGDILSSGFGQNPSKKYVEETEASLETTLKERHLDLTPLAMAAYKDNRDVANLLLEAGADSELADHFSCTVLHHVAMRGDLVLAQTLEKQNADVAALNDEKKSPADVAEENEHMSLVNFIQGKELYKHAARFTTCMESTKKQLSEGKLGDLRGDGKDIRRHLIATLRDLTIDINKVLLDLGSGPVQEESLDNQNQQSSGSSSTAFAGVRQEHAPFPTLVSCETPNESFRAPQMAEPNVNAGKWGK